MDPITLPLSLQNEEQLHRHHMLMIKGGGLFVPSTHELMLNMSVMVELNLRSLKKKAKIPAKVIWVVPAGAQRGKTQGVGVSFTGEHRGKIKQYIETLLMGKMGMPAKNPIY